MNKEDLIIEAASVVYEDWCEQEYLAFFKRAREAYIKGESVSTALNLACYKGEQKRNEVSIALNDMFDAEATMGMGYFDPNMNTNILSSFEYFMTFVKASTIKIKRFTKRNLTMEEQLENSLSGDYKVETGEENILRPFRSLSADSKIENLDAAIGAYNVFETFSKAGISVAQMEIDEKLRNLIGVAIHVDWLKRNKEHPNSSLKVAYSELDDWTKQQDLTVFNALLSVVKANNISIGKVDGYTLPDYLVEEQIVLEQIKKKTL